jgi:hypothetical protein
MAEAAQKCLVLVMKATLEVSNLLAHNTILLCHTADLLGKVLNLLGIANKMTHLLRNNALSVMLQLEQVLGVLCHVHPITVVVNLIEVACLIHVSLPLRVRAVLDRVRRDCHTRSGRNILRAQGSECHVSGLLHSITHIIPDRTCGPQAPIRKHGVRWNLHIDLTMLQVVPLKEPTIVLGRCVP